MAEMVLTRKMFVEQRLDSVQFVVFGSPAYTGQAIVYWPLASGTKSCVLDGLADHFVGTEEFDIPNAYVFTNR
jgi:hypothetical protein